MKATINEMNFVPDLLFDLGMHRGYDTKFYLDKGFRVIGLEANPEMVDSARATFAQAISDSKLIVVDRALWSVDNVSVPFFLNPVKDDWSSAFKGWAEKGGHQTTEICVRTITLGRLFEYYGIPYYIKCDVEGADEIFVRQLVADRRRPPFVSIEATSLDALALLYSAGYDRVQIINQALNAFVKPPNPPREGGFVPMQFHGHMSGLFGLELDPDRWIDFASAADRYLRFRQLSAKDELLAHGWLDFHVTNSEVLSHMKARR